VDDDAVHRRPKIDEIAAYPASPAVRPPRQAQLVPPSAVGGALRPNGEHDAELAVLTPSRRA
jgi:hypothetical protein